MFVGTNKVTLTGLKSGIDVNINETGVYRSKNKKHSSQSNNNSMRAFTAGTVYSNVNNESYLYFDDKILTPRGYGFASEHANHMADLYQGKNVKIVRDDNAKNGADQIVNGMNVQSKYCTSTMFL